MYGADYVWILQESQNKSWWDVEEQYDCSIKHLHAAVENVIIVSSLNHIVGDEKSISGLVSDDDEDKKQDVWNERIFK